MEQHDWSERRACKAVGLSRSTVRYPRRPDRDEEVIALLAELAERFPERGFDKLFQLIRRRGLVWNHKRVWRVYCLMRLNHRRRGKRRVPSRHPAAAGFRGSDQQQLVDRLHVRRALGWAAFPHVQRHR